MKHVAAIGLLALSMPALGGCSSESGGSGTSGNGGNTGTSSGTGASMGTGGTGSGTGSGTPSGTGTGTTNPACENLTGEGFAFGQIAEDWSLPNHLGAMTNLHQYCGKPVLMEFSSMW